MKKLRNFIDLEPKEFIAVWVEDGDMQEQRFTLEMTLSEDAFEWQYAIVEKVNELNALPVNDNIFFYGNRDNEQTKGIVLRVK